MKTTFLSLPKGLTNQSRNALIVISSYFSAAVVTTVIFVIQLLKAPSMQLWIAELSPPRLAPSYRKLP